MLIVITRFSCLVTLLDAAFRVVCPTVKALIPKPTSGETHNIKNIYVLNCLTKIFI